MKKRYSEEQIIQVIKRHEAGARVDDLRREIGKSSGTFYNWRRKYAGIEVNVTPEAPRCLIEALISGTPIVGYESAYASDLVGGIFSKMRDTHALSDFLCVLAEDRKQLANMIKQASKAVFKHRSDLIKTFL